MEPTDLIAEGRAALRRGDGAAARATFQEALDRDGSVEAIEGLATSAYLEHDFQESIEIWELAYARHRNEGNALGALRAARMLAYLYGTIVGNGAVMHGWLARAQTLLPEGTQTVEAGWVALSLGQFEEDRATRERCFRESLDVARRFNDTDLEFASLAYLGASLVHDDRGAEGFVLLDEACAATAGREVDDYLTLSEIFCQLFSACEHAHDLARAEEWLRIGEAIAAQRNISAVSAYCRTHYGGLMTAAGRWDEANLALTEAVRLWGLGHKGLRFGALVRLADLRVRQGRLEEAGQLLEGLDMNTEAARPLAALHLARGNAALAVDVLDRALTQMDPTSAAAGLLWATFVDVHLARDAIDDARRAAENLEAVASRHPGHYLEGLAALAKGRICVASGDGDPRACLRNALSDFAKAQMPIETARTRLELATAVRTDQPEVAVAEARAAFETFERLDAGRDADEAAALLRSLGVTVAAKGKGVEGLTKREAEVLDLLGLGLSNPVIADRLFISRKTVEHHVGNVLMKLGLRSRAEAAAYTARLGAGTSG